MGFRESNLGLERSDNPSESRSLSLCVATQYQHRRRLGYFAGSSAENDRLCTCGGVLGTNADNESINGVPRLSLPVLPGVGVSGGPGSDLAPSVPGGQAVGVYISEGSYRGCFT